MGQDMDETQFCVNGTRHFEHLAAAWQVAAPHLYKAQKCRSGRDSTSLPQALPAKATSSAQSSMAVDPAFASSLHTPTAQKRSVEATLPTSPRNKVHSNPVAAPNGAMKTQSPPTSNPPQAPHTQTTVATSSAKSASTEPSNPAKSDRAVVEKPLNGGPPAQTTVTTPAKNAVDISPNPRKSDHAPVEKSFNAAQLAPNSQTEQPLSTNHAADDAVDEPGRAKTRPATNHIACAQHVKDFLTFIEAGTQKAHKDAPAWQDLYNEAKNDFETYRSAPEKHKALIRKTGASVKAWQKSFESLLAKATRNTRKQNPASNASKSDAPKSNSNNKMDIDAPPAAPLVPSVSEMSVLAASDSTNTGPIVSGFLAKKLSEQVSPTTAAAVSSSSATIASESTQSFAKPNDKKRPREEISKTSSVKEKTDKSLSSPSKKSAQPPPTKKSKYFLDEADEIDDDDDEGESVGLSQDSLVDFIVDSDSEDEPFDGSEQDSFASSQSFEEDEEEKASNKDSDSD